MHWLRHSHDPRERAAARAGEHLHGDDGHSLGNAVGRTADGGCAMGAVATAGG